MPLGGKADCKGAGGLSQTRGPDEVFRLLRRGGGGGGGGLRGQRGGGDQRDDFMVGHLVVNALGIK